MQCTQLASEGLSRVLQVIVPKADLQAKLDAKLVEMRPQLQLKGFRKGMAPLSFLKRMYGASLMGEIIENAVQEHTDAAIKRENLRPAMTPSVHLESDPQKVAAGEIDLQFHMHVDVMPTIELAELAGLSFERLVTPVEEEDIVAGLQELADAAKTYAEKEGAAEEGDQLILDFVGSIDGEEFPGGKAEGAPLVLGSGSFIPGFEAQLTGAAAGEERRVEVTFPTDYPSAHLAGKDAVFAVTVKEVKSPVAADFDDAFASRFGFPNIGDLRDAMRRKIDNERKAQSRLKLKRKLLDHLDSAHSFDLPGRMVEAEFQQIWAQIKADLDRGEIAPEDQDKDEATLQSEYRKIAERRVRLGLVLAEIGQRRGVMVTNDEVAQAMSAQARQYPGQEKQIVDFYRKNPEALAQLRAPIFEEKVVDSVIASSTLTDRVVPKDELFAEDPA